MSDHNDDLPEIPDPLYDLGVTKPAPAPAPTRANAPAPTPVPEVEEDEYSEAVDIPEPVQAYVPPPPRDDKHRDKFDSAIQMAFVGAGQGGVA